MILHRIFEKTVQEIFYDKICNLSVNTEELMACGRSPHFYLFHNSEDITRPISSLEIFLFCLCNSWFCILVF